MIHTSILRLSSVLAWLPFLFLAGSAVAGPERSPRAIVLLPELAHREGVSVSADGAATLARGIDRGRCVWDADFRRPTRIVGVSWDHATTPSRDLTPSADVIVQIRHRVGQDGAWSPWWPPNLLPGGEFRDTDHSGLPDKADIIEYTTQGLVLSDLPDSRMPKWVVKHIDSVSPGLVHEKKGFGPVLSFDKPKAPGQAIVEMRSDRIPPADFITVSGWNGWDLGNVHTMGLMSRFHEIDTTGDRLNKIMFIGDDDWNQPGGRAPLRWRAVTFQPRAETRRLNLYAARLISSAGRLDAARYQIRADSLTDPRFLGPLIEKFPFTPKTSWSFKEPNLARMADGVLTLRPRPHTNTFALSPTFDLPDVSRLVFRVEMDVKVPERYNDFDPSHKIWASTYLELLDEGGAVVGVIKISVCRPRFGTILAAAGERPPSARKARFRLVASHQSYLSADKKANINGEMIARWRGLELFKCRYPTDWRGRLDEQPIRESELAPAASYQIRAVLLGDSKVSPPRLRSVQIRVRDK